MSIKSSSGKTGKPKSFEVISGNMVNTNVGEMVRTFMLFKETGALSIAFEGRSRSIFFRRGLLVYAHTSVDEESLLGRARNQGILDDATYKSMRRLHRSMGITHESMLVTKGVITSRNLVPMVKELTRDLATDLIGWNVGVYRYIFGVHPPGKSIACQMEIEPIILAGTARLKDEDLVRRWLGNLAAIPRLNMKNPAFAKLKLGSVEGYILSRIDGATNLRQLVAMVQQDKLKTLSFLYGAFLANLILFDEDSLASRDYTFDLDVERESNYRLIRASDLRKDEFDLRPGDVNEEDEVTVVLDGQEGKLDDAFDGKLKVSDIAELEEEMKDRLFRPQNLPLNEKGLELRYQIWVAYLADKDKKRMARNVGGLLTSSGSLAMGDVAATMEARRIQQLKKDISHMMKIIANGTFYELLDLAVTANSVDIGHAYRHLRDKFDPEKYTAGELGHYHSLLRELAKALDEANATLTDPARRAEYDANLEVLRAKLAEQNRRKREMADEKYQLGNQELARQDVMRALDYYRSAISLFPDEPIYLERMALTLARRKNWVRDSLRILRNAIDLDPNNPRYHVVMGNICKVHGEKIAAVRAYRRASKLDPSNAQLTEEIRQLIQGT